MIVLNLILNDVIFVPKIILNYGIPLSKKNKTKQNKWNVQNYSKEEQLIDL